MALSTLETTATYLTAALASKSNLILKFLMVLLAERGSSSRTNVLSSPRSLQNNSPEVGLSASHEIVEDSSYTQPASKDEKPKSHDRALVGSFVLSEIGNCKTMDCTCSGTAGVSVNPGGKHLSMTEDKSLTPKEIVSKNP